MRSLQCVAAGGAAEERVEQLQLVVQPAGGGAWGRGGSSSCCSGTSTTLAPSNPLSHAPSSRRTPPCPRPAQKNVVLWPFTTIRYHWETQSVVWDSYNVVEAAKAKA